MDLVKTSPRDPLNSEISISELGLSTRAVNALMSVGLDTLEKVSSKTYEELLKIPRIGQVTAAEITRKVHRTMRDTGKPTKGSLAAIMDLDLLVLALDRRAFRSLTNAGISTVGELIALDKKTLLTFKGIGEKTCELIDRALQHFLKQREEGDIAIANLGLDNRTLNALSKNGIFYVSQIANMSREELASLSGIGTTSLNNLLTRYTLVTGKTIASSREKYKLDHTCESKTPLEKLDLPSRAYNALKNSGFSFVEEIINLKDSDFLSIKNIGERSLKAILHELERFNGRGSAMREVKSLDDCIYLLETVLSDRQRDILNRRLAIWAKYPETLESIAKDYGLSRERVRQIEKKARKKLFAASNIKTISPLLEELRGILRSFGGVCSINYIATELLKKLKARRANTVTVIPLFLGLAGCRELSEGLWALDGITKDQIDAICERAESIIVEKGHLDLDELVDSIATAFAETEKSLIRAVVASSKKLVVAANGKVQLSERILASKSRVDYAKVVLRRLKRPAHYREITELINEMLPEKNRYSPKSIQVALGSSKDMVRVQVGTYALREDVN